MVQYNVNLTSNTFLLAIKPDVKLEVDDDSDSLTYSVTGSEYTVEVGHEFGLLCTSSGNFSGEIMWYKVQSSGGNCSCVLNNNSNSSSN